VNEKPQGMALRHKKNNEISDVSIEVCQACGAGHARPALKGRTRQGTAPNRVPVILGIVGPEDRLEAPAA
jgi:hypothetical protein